jgi:hypothetical protein
VPAECIEEQRNQRLPAVGTTSWPYDCQTITFNGSGQPVRDYLLASDLMDSGTIKSDLLTTAYVSGTKAGFLIPKAVPGGFVIEQH